MKIVDTQTNFMHYRGLKTTVGQVCSARINESLRKRNFWGVYFLNLLLGKLKDRRKANINGHVK